MRRRTLLGLAIGWVARPFAATAREQPPRIGVLGPAPGPFSILLEAALGDIGFKDGETVKIEWRLGQLDRLADLAAELVAMPVDILVTISHRVATIAKRTTTTVPIVFTAVNDPIGVGLVASLASPGGNITGVSLEGYDLIGKRLQLLKEIVPNLAVVAYMTDPTEPYSPAYLTEVRNGAKALGLRQVLPLSVRTPDEIGAAFAELARQPADALLVEPNSLTVSQRKRIADASLAQQLPAMYGLRQFMDPAAGLISYGASLPEHFRRAVACVDKVLKGTRPADIPVEQPTKFELVINLKTAKALGLTVPQSLLARADEVIE